VTESAKPSLTARLAQLGILSADAEAAGFTLRGNVDGGGTPVITDGLRVGEEIGRGAMASIKRAEQGSLLRTVAIKTLLEDKRTPGDQRAFFAESLVTAHLEHPNIVPVHDLVRDEDGLLQLVMKRVLGRTWQAILHPIDDLDERVADVMELDDHLDVLTKVCDAVAYAHSRGVMHRDLKPENVMIGDFGEVLVMDWGCAATFDRDRPIPGVPHFADLTTISGTPNYIAPEVARADDEATGPRSDVYCLGGILYEILTGEPPHRGDDVRKVLEHAASGEWVPPRHRNPARAMPDELVELCEAAMCTDVAERLRDVTDFAERLRDHRRHGDAHRLADAARRHIQEAEAGPVQRRGRLLRRAVACFEQAIEQWPHRSIRIQAVGALLTAARFAGEQGDRESARSDARHARKLAEELGFNDQMRHAEELLERWGETNGEEAANTAPVASPDPTPAEAAPVDGSRERGSARGVGWALVLLALGVGVGVGFALGWFLR